MGLNPGDLIDEKYRIVRLIGEGGMGAVYEGENTRIHRRVAIKVLHANVAGMTDVVARFEHEAQAAGRIGSEHIVEVLDLGTLSSGDRYMVMEFMDGDSLSQRIQERGRMQPGELYPIAHQLLDALAAAHTAGIIHRDLKPDNVFLLRNRRSQPDFVKLLDFGISKFGGGSSGLSMTRTGAVMGTPYYMAPEQAKGSREIDHRVDLYAIGVILYEALAGQVPFLADTFNELLFKIVLEKPRPLAELAPNLDAHLTQLVEKAMARDPAERFQSARELQQALDDWALSAGLNANATGGYAAVSSRNTGQGHRSVPTPLETAQLASTPGTWSGTSTSAEPNPFKPKASRASLVATFAAMVVVAGGSGAYMLVSGKAPPSAASSSPSSGINGRPGAALASALPVAPPEPAKPSPDPEKPVVDLAPAPSAKSDAPSPTAKATAHAAPAGLKAAAKSAAAKAAAVAAVKAAPAPAPARTEGMTTSGRKIRQSL